MTSYTYIHNTIQQKTHNGPKSAKGKRLMPTDDPDWTPGSSQPQKMKRTAGARSGGESALTSREVSADKEWKRLQHVWCWKKRL